MKRTLETVLPGLGRVSLTVEPLSTGVSLRLSTGYFSPPALILSAEDAQTLGRELLRAGADSVVASGALGNLPLPSKGAG